MLLNLTLKLLYFFAYMQCAKHCKLLCVQNGNLRTMSTDKWATSKPTQLSTKVWVNCSFRLKTQFWDLINWKFEPSPRPHTHSDPIINKHTEQVKKLCMDLSWHALNSMLQVKLFVTLKSKDLANRGLQKISRHTCWSWVQFQKGQPTSCKTMYVFPCSQRVSATNLLPLTGSGLRPAV